MKKAPNPVHVARIDKDRKKSGTGLGFEEQNTRKLHQRNKDDVPQMFFSGLWNDPVSQMDHFWVIISFCFIKSKYMLFRLHAQMERTGSDSCEITHQLPVAFYSHVCWGVTAPLLSVNILGFFFLTLLRLLWLVCVNKNDSFMHWKAAVLVSEISSYDSSAKFKRTMT
ncbi:hypothetical protein ILYODFUR_019933 [Ilyodon furcidens]|uniref:Uncharacterized protein n=1 Tax=Ilyodon furcidens TaxID=33524 RepID=A0ABV0UXG0_9TELE